MPKTTPPVCSEEKQSLFPINKSFMRIEKPFAYAHAPSLLFGEKLMMIPLMMEHSAQLHKDIFNKPQVMRYFGSGKPLMFDEYASLHLKQVQENLVPQYNNSTGKMVRFNWAIITHDGIAGRFSMYSNEGCTELSYCISPTQQGRGLARRASELGIAYWGEETDFVATAHPKNKASSKTLEQVRYPNGKFVFFRDPKRQNVQNVYGENQPRDYFVSRRQEIFSFYSYTRGRVLIDMSKESVVP